MKTPRGGVFVAPYEDKLWAIGGRISEISDLSSAEVYDPEVNLWSNTETPLKSIAGMVKGCTFTSKDFKQN